MAIDKDEERVNAVLPFVTNAQIGDSTSEEFLSVIGVRNFDVCIVAIGDNFQSSLETASLLKELGAKKVVAREEQIGISKDFNNFELVNALVEKNSYKAFVIVKYFNNNPKSFSLQVTLSVLFNFFSNLMLAYYAPQKNEEGISVWTGLPKWQVVRNIIPAMKNYSGVKVMQIIGELRKTDAKSKGIECSNTSNGELLRGLIYYILH